MSTAYGFVENPERNGTLLYVPVGIRPWLTHSPHTGNEIKSTYFMRKRVFRHLEDFKRYRFFKFTYERNYDLLELPNFKLVDYDEVPDALQSCFMDWILKE